MKKRCLIKPNGYLCPACKEFNINEYLPVFHFIHFNKENKMVTASDLYNLYSIPEIAKILEKELGMFICSNCHSIFDYKRFHLLDKIYENDIIKKISSDYRNVSQHIKPFQYTNSIKNFIEKSKPFTNNIQKYLVAIYQISKSNKYVTPYTLANYLRIDPCSVFNFFKQNEIIRQYINIEIGKSNSPSKYYLNEKGKEAISLISYIRDYYSQL